MVPSGPARRERLLGLLLLGVALVLLISSPTWFASGQAGVGVAQVFLAVVVAGVGGWLYRRGARAGRRGAVHPGDARETSPPGGGRGAGEKNGVEGEKGELWGGRGI